jgi:hypothetical protein
MYLDSIDRTLDNPVAVQGYSAGIISPDQKLTEEDKDALKQTFWNQNTSSSLANYESYLGVLNEVLADEKVSESVKKVALYKKAVALTTVRNTNTDISTRNTKEAGELFTRLYNSPVVTEDDQVLKELSILGLVKTYVGHCFYSHIASYGLPKPYSTEYNAYTETTSDNLELQKKSFQVHIKLAYDPSIKNLSNDRFFVSNRLYLLAHYMHTFKNKMSASEFADISSKMAKDLKDFPNLGDVYPTPQFRSVTLAGFYYAYAYDVYHSVALGVTGKENEVITANYEKALSNIKLEGDPVSNSIVGGFITSFYMDSLYRRYGYEQKKVKIDELADTLNMYLNYTKDTQNVLPQFFKSYQTYLGKWSKVKTELFELSKKSKKLGDVFVNMGVKS